MRTAEEIQGQISEIQETNLPFEDQVKAINNLLNDWKREIEFNHTTDLVVDAHKQHSYAVLDFGPLKLPEPDYKFER